MIRSPSRTSGRARFVARSIMWTRWVDSAHTAFDKARSRAVLRLVSSDVLAEFNALAYERDEAYVTGAERFRSRLFVWERATIRQHFPAAPARLLVGGAGGGREAFALAEQGYDVVAFEPAPGLAAGMAASAAAGGRVQAFRARYEDLPALFPARPGDTGADLRALPRFDGAVMGWGSFSHLMDEESRVRALSALGEVVDGPVLVSFLAFRLHDDGRRARGRDRRGDAFSVFIGYHHVSDVMEVERLAAAAGLELVALETDENESSWPHAVLRRAALDR